MKNALKSIQDCPERGIRNLIDMALQFSKGRFQQNFFLAAQTMLQNENSAYYRLVRDLISYTDLNRLYTFGMNVGYNGCTVGAKRIRENEKRMGCHIPWTVLFQLDGTHFGENRPRYEAALREGENLGIYVWLLFAGTCPQNALALAEGHTDSAFCIFCRPEDLSGQFLNEAGDLPHVMLVPHYQENAPERYRQLRDRGLLYSVWYPYSARDVRPIQNGDLFCSLQQVSPAFAVLLPEPDCPEEAQQAAYQAIRQARMEQTYHTLLWELPRDNGSIDRAISEGGRALCFDGKLNVRGAGRQPQSLFQHSLSEILLL